MKRMWALACFSAGFIGALSACGSGEDANSGSPNLADAEAGSSDSVGCSGDPRVTTFAAGIQAKSTSGRLVAEIVNASPSPPERGEGDAGMNVWTMKFTLDGLPPAVSAIGVATYMPDHGHRSPLVPNVAANGDGTYTLTDLYLFMGGVWQISFFPTADGGAPLPQDTAMFSLCVN